MNTQKNSANAQTGYMFTVRHGKPANTVSLNQVLNFIANCNRKQLESMLLALISRRNTVYASRGTQRKSA